MRCRGADSPRSASPIGPAPTRLPRIALPPATVMPLASLCCFNGPCCLPTGGGFPPVYEAFWRLSPTYGLVAALDLEAEGDDRRGPHDAARDGEPVEVLLDDRRAGGRGRDAAAEHVGPAAA